MNIYRQNKRAGKWIHALAVMLFCMVLSIGTVVLADEVPATVIASAAKIRATASTSSDVLAGVKSGDTLSICGQTTGEDGKVWYQVYVNADTKGFIRSDLIQKNSEGTIATVPNENANANASASTTTTTTTTTAVDRKNVTVVTNGVRIRKGASTQHDVVATANRGMVLTITGETSGSDGKVWYQVVFSYNNKEITGFIRSDLVTSENVPNTPAVSEITGTEETPAETVTEEPATEQPSEPVAEEPEAEPEDENANIILMNVEEEVYVLPEFEQIILKWEDQNINAFKNGKFYLFYAQKQSGETGWFLYDSENGVYQRYVYDTADATVPSSGALSGSLLPILILGVVVVILLVVIVLMFLKLREYTMDYYDDDDEEYDDDEDEEDDELEEEDSEEEEEPVKRPLGKRPTPQQEGNGQPARRPVPQQGGNGQPPRRPMPQEGGEPPRRPAPQQGGNGQPARRPAPQQGGNGQPPRRPAPQQEGNGQPARRPAPQQGGNGQPPKRPTQQQNRPQKGNQQLQNGRKAKNFLDAEDDDMEFIDI